MRDFQWRQERKTCLRMDVLAPNVSHGEGTHSNCLRTTSECFHKRGISHRETLPDSASCLTGMELSEMEMVKLQATHPSGQSIVSEQWGLHVVDQLATFRKSQTTRGRLKRTTSRTTPSYISHVKLVETTLAARVSVFRKTVKTPIFVDGRGKGGPVNPSRIIGPKQTPDIEIPI
ncbi:hypothetical protein V2G26_020133 [Clonostachys chloroleuca]